MNFFNRLQELLEENKISQRKLITDLHIGAGTISTWKTRGTIPSGEVLLQISDYFNVSVDYLLGKSTKKTESPPARELSELEKEFIELIRDISEEQAQQLLTLLRSFQREK